MHTKPDIFDKFPAHIFWDIDSSCLDIKKDMNFIIARVLFATATATFDRDISQLELLYTRDQIINALKNTKERISNNVCNLVADRYFIEPFKRFDNLKS